MVPMASRRYRRFRRWRRTHRWLLVLVATAVSATLTLAGLVVVLTRDGERPSIDDAFFGTIKLFSTPQTLIENPPGLLRWARVVSALVLVLAAEGAAAVVFREPLDRFSARRRRRHVVVCGLGATGARLAESFADQGQAVVVVDRAPDVTAVERCRDRGVPVIVGDACDGQILRAAGVRRARHLLAFCGDDGVNATVALAATAELAGRSGPPLRCTLHVDDPALCQLLAVSQLSAAGADGTRSCLRLRFFNPGLSVAPALLAAHPPFEETATGHDRAPRLLVVGLGSVGEGLVVHAARTWNLLAEDRSEQLRITVLDLQATSLVEALCRRHRSLAKVCRIEAIDIDVADPAFPPDGLLGAGTGGGDAVTPFTVVYVCLGEDAMALSVALAIRQAWTGPDVPVIVRTSTRHGLAALLGRPAGPPLMVAFDVLGRTSRPEVVLNGPNEMLARFIHEEYMRCTPTATVGAWDELPESLRDSNRDQADHIGAKLAALGCSVLALSDWNGELVAFSDSEVELLSGMEHDRWLQERRAAGWKPGPPPSDPVRLRSPYLVGWEDLPDEIRERDRDAVRALPRLLVRAGYQCVRREPGEVLARAIHADYIRRESASGRLPADDPALRPWADLPTTLQESNRGQARGIGANLESIGCTIAPVTSRGAGPVVITPEELETMAQQEHARWVRHRRASGWTEGPRDPVARTTPYLVEWEALTEEARNLDRDAVRAIPALLAEAGFTVVRRPPGG